MIDPKFVERIAQEVSGTTEQVIAAIDLLDAGTTIPFIARYRKDVVGGLTEAVLERIAERSKYFTGLMNQRAGVLKAVEKQGKLDDALRSAIMACVDKTALEDLYLPFKKRRPTKATLARQKGLEPLADLLWLQNPAVQDIEMVAEEFVRPEKLISSVEEALEGARYILAERLTMNAQLRAAIRERMLN
ncbi:MAG TPA: RNA-binding transcriptional accessory protein, partial [Candidatus Hydrogenedentes bacterium]|nr:RNA-binding transcriptional accessory protein [Candidatus Hydrogenedentota bacterium]